MRKKEKSSTSNLTATSNTPSAKKETKNARQSPWQRQQQLVDHTLTLLVVENGLSLALTTCCRVFFPVKYEIKSISIQINDSKNPKIMRHFSVEKTQFVIIKTEKNISVGFRLSFLTPLFYLFDDIPRFKEMIYDIPEQEGLLTQRQGTRNVSASLYLLCKSVAISFVQVTFAPTRGLDHSDVTLRDALPSEISKQ